ncbi:MAG: hypothetical protein Cons2KO_00290 [Congregibacter sp.]
MTDSKRATLSTLAYSLLLFFVFSLPAISKDKHVQFRAHPFLSFDSPGSLTADLVVYGDADVSFLPAVSLPDEGRGSPSITPVDVAPSGRRDILIARRNGQVSVLMKNLGDRRYEAVRLPGSEGDRRKVVVADLNSNGKVNSVSVSTDGTHLLYGFDDEGSLKKLRSSGAGNRVAQATAAADLDADGDIDLTEGTETNIGIYWLDGGGFFSRQDLPGEADTYGVSVGDMNGDGKPDIVFANSEAKYLVLIAG